MQYIIILSSLSAVCRLLQALAAIDFQTCADNSISCRCLVFLHPVFSHFVIDLWGEQSSARFIPVFKNKLLTWHWLVHSINLSSFQTLPSCFVLGFGKMVLRQAEQHFTFCVHMTSCIATWCQPGLSIVFVDLLVNFNKVHHQSDTRYRTHNSGYWTGFAC